MASLHLLISGRVQGVGFRAFVKDQAQALALDGWVRNRADGTVEAAIAGAEGVVAQMVERCRDGPLGAEVTELKTTPHGEPIASGFEVLATR